MTGYWPWWLGAFALATVAVLHPLLTGRLFGVSGLFSRALSPSALKEERALAAIGDMEKAMLEATRAEFGEAAMTVAANDPPAPEPSEPTIAPRFSFRASWLFIVAIAAGGALSAVISSRFGTTEMGNVHRALFGDGALALLSLFGGGFLVGFGTQMTGGCTSGHGLSGCGRMQAASFLATAAFYGTGIVVSLVLASVLL